jgi:hypothetical protein
MRTLLAFGLVLSTAVFGSSIASADDALALQRMDSENVKTSLRTALGASDVEIQSVSKNLGQAAVNTVISAVLFFSDQLTPLSRNTYDIKLKVTKNGQTFYPTCEVDRTSSGALVLEGCRGYDSSKFTDFKKVLLTQSDIADPRRDAHVTPNTAKGAVHRSPALLQSEPSSPASSQAAN